MCRIASGIKEFEKNNINLIVNCFDYQKEYVAGIVKKEYRNKIIYAETEIREGSDEDEE